MLVDARGINTPFSKLNLAKAAADFAARWGVLLSCPERILVSESESIEVPKRLSQSMMEFKMIPEVRVHLLAGALLRDQSGDLWLAPNFDLPPSSHVNSPIRSKDILQRKGGFVFIYAVIGADMDISEAAKGVTEELNRQFVGDVGVILVVERFETANSHDSPGGVFDFLSIAVQQALVCPALSEWLTVEMIGAQLRLILLSSSPAGRLVEVVGIGGKHSLQLCRRQYVADSLIRDAPTEAQDQALPVFADIRQALETYRLQRSLSDQHRILELPSACSSAGVIMRLFALGGLVVGGVALDGLLSVACWGLAVWAVWNMIRVLSRWRPTKRRFAVFTPEGFGTATIDKSGEASLVLIPWVDSQPQNLVFQRQRDPLGIGAGLHVFLNSARPLKDYAEPPNGSPELIQRVYPDRELAVWHLREDEVPQQELYEFRKLLEWSVSRYFDPRESIKRITRYRDLAAQRRCPVEPMNAALLIGVSEYDYLRPSLPGASRDLFRMDWLMSSWPDTPAKPDVSSLPNPTAAEFRQRIEQELNGSTGRNVVLLFAGHGLCESGELVLAARDTRPDAPIETDRKSVV